MTNPPTAPLTETTPSTSQILDNAARDAASIQYRSPAERAKAIAKSLIDTLRATPAEPPIVRRRRRCAPWATRWQLAELRRLSGCRRAHQVYAWCKAQDLRKKANMPFVALPAGFSV